MPCLLDTTQEHLGGLNDVTHHYALYRDGNAYYMTIYASHIDGMTKKQRRNVTPKVADILVDTYLLQIWREAWNGTLKEADLQVRRVSGGGGLMPPPVKRCKCAKPERMIHGDYCGRCDGMIMTCHHCGKPADGIYFTQDRRAPAVEMRQHPMCPECGKPDKWFIRGKTTTEVEA
ncbi:MAG: hypothetical protein J4F28_02035 [Nitrosopumilaceae archaeon]|nr:hypothetical protein [Nitrosopumilaceae archaeon]